MTFHSRVWWTHKHCTSHFYAKREKQCQSLDTQVEIRMKIQPDKYINMYQSTNCCVFQQTPLPLILLLSGWIFHRNTNGCHWSANKLPPDFPWHLCPVYKVTPTTVRSSEGKREGGWGGRGWGGGGGRYWQKQVGRKSEWRELTHMWQDRGVLLMGREKYNNLNKRDDRCGFHQTPISCSQQHLSHSRTARKQ